jgi:hypothetical protein
VAPQDMHVSAVPYSGSQQEVFAAASSMPARAMLLMLFLRWKPVLHTKLGVLAAAPFVSAQVALSGYVVVQFPLLVICHTAATPTSVHVACVALPLPMQVALQVPPTLISQFVAHFAFCTYFDGIVLHSTADTNHHAVMLSDHCVYMLIEQFSAQVKKAPKCTSGTKHYVRCQDGIGSCGPSVMPDARGLETESLLHSSTPYCRT